MKFCGHDRHLNVHESAGANLGSEIDKLGLSMFCCLLLALSSQKERKQRWIIVHVLNFILNEFRPFSVHSSCWMQDAKCARNVRLLKVCFD